MGEGERGKLELEIPRGLQEFSLYPNTSAVLETPRKYPKPQKTVSVILPVYRTKAYIRQCLESLLNQETKADYEIIVVEDGCPDQTLSEAEDLLADPKIQVIRQENKGLSGARNTGIDRAAGEYLVFVDSDDYVMPWMLEALIKPMRSGQMDLTAAGYTERKERNGRTQERLLEGGKAGPYGITGFAWAKAFHRGLFERIRFPEGYWFEDTIIKHLIAPMAAGIFCCEQPVYVYRNRKGSISRNAGSSPKCIDSTWITWQMLKDRRVLGLVNDRAYLDYFLRQLVLNFKRERKVPEEIKKQIFSWTAQIVRNEFPESVFLKGDWKKGERLYRSLLEENYRAYCWYCRLAR